MSSVEGLGKPLTAGSSEESASQLRTNAVKSALLDENCSSYCSTSENEAKIGSREGLELIEGLAGTTGFEPATSDVTGRRSNQLNYVPEV